VLQRSRDLLDNLVGSQEEQILAERRAQEEKKVEKKKEREEKIKEKRKQEKDDLDEI